MFAFDMVQDQWWISRGVKDDPVVLESQPTEILREYRQQLRDWHLAVANHRDAIDAEIRDAGPPPPDAECWMENQYTESEQLGMELSEISSEVRNVERILASRQ